MQEFNILLTLKDCLICNGCKQIFEKEINVYSTAQTITLLNGYILNIIAVSSSKCTVLIQNGPCIFIRNIYNYETKLCIPDRNCKRIISISCLQND